MLQHHRRKRSTADAENSGARCSFENEPHVLEGYHVESRSVLPDAGGPALEKKIVSREIATLEKWLDRRELELDEETLRERGSREEKESNSAFFVRHTKKLVDNYVHCLQKIATQVQHSSKDRYKFFLRVIKGITDAFERIGLLHFAELAKSESSNRALRVDLEKLRTHLQSLQAADSGDGIVKEVLDKLDSVERELHLDAADDPWLQHYLKRKRGNSQDTARVLREILNSLNSNDQSKDRLREELLGEGIDFDEW